MYTIANYKIYHKFVNDVLDTERTTVNISDDKKKIASAETLTVHQGSLTVNSVAVIRYQYDNHLGSASLELDDSGGIISYEEYHPFGTTSYRSGRTETEASQKRYKYVGKERDEETGLYYYGFRYYAAWLCRFVSVDPLQFEYPHYTPFQYAGNKPISYIDLDGLEPAFPDHIDPNKRVHNMPNLTWGDLFTIVNGIYKQVMNDSYITEDGKGGHMFDGRRWLTENAPDIIKERGSIKWDIAKTQYHEAKGKANKLIYSKEYNLFFHNYSIDFGRNDYNSVKNKSEGNVNTFKLHGHTIIDNHDVANQYRSMFKILNIFSLPGVSHNNVSNTLPGALQDGSIADFIASVITLMDVLDFEFAEDKPKFGGSTEKEILESISAVQDTFYLKYNIFDKHPDGEPESRGMDSVKLHVDEVESIMKEMKKSARKISDKSICDVYVSFYK